MKIDIFTLCDGVQCYENKLVVVGAYDVLFLNNFAATPIGINIAARILFDESECGSNMVHIEGTETASGMKVLELSNPVNISKRENVDTGLLNVSLAGIPVIFPREGKYRFSLTINGNCSQNLILNVLATPQPPQTGK